jgi:hypothetical protein
LTYSQLLRKIEDEIKVLSMSLSDDSWRLQVPASPGWYFIETDTPVKLAFGNCKYAIPRKAASGVGFKPGEKKRVCLLC